MAERPFTVSYPSDLHQLVDGSPLYGYLHPATRQVVVVGGEAVRPRQPTAIQLGWLEPAPAGCVDAAGCAAAGLQAFRSGDRLVFEVEGHPCQARPYDLHSDLFSRQVGLLETERMHDCGVIVCGCGSVGSQAALDLARSGVGRFLLIDPDLLAIENLCRHQCGLADVGRHKVSAVAERIHQINPRAEVVVHASPLEQLDPALVAAFARGSSTLMLACADSRRADRYAARLATTLGLPFLAIGLWERAFAGEIFYSHPGAEMPCYGCAFEGLSDTLTAPAPSQRRFYTTEADLERVSFEPGIAIDIGLVTLIGLKLAIDLLNLHNPRHVPRLLGVLSQYTLVCNSNDPRLGGERAEIFSHPLQVTTSIRVDYGAGCPPCRWTQ